MNPDSRQSSPGPVTPPEIYFNRRTFLRGGIAAASIVATGVVYRTLSHMRGRSIGPARLPRLIAGATTKLLTMPSPPEYNVNEKWTSFEGITHYNNFYEFSTDKDSVADEAANFTTTGWRVAVDGLAAKPQIFDLDDLQKIAPAEQRVYRMRCVEGWSMVIPWAGYSLSKLLDRVQPLGSAKYVAFTSLLDPHRFPNQSDDSVLPWPYVEGLRMDEAMHPLTLLASGLYGRELPAQDGAPVRLVVPWKYGFKGIKSIVKISLTADQPQTTWSARASDEYGFYANVNPHVDHPRWSQATERRIDETGGHRQPTLMFNGYAEQVAKLYAGMDLRRDF